MDVTDMYRTTSPIEKAAELLRRKMTNLNGLADTLVRDVKALARDRVEISANRPIVKENERCPQLYLVESGWVFKSRGLASGRRQIVNYALPGDILCADSLLFKSSGFDLTARTSVSVIRIEAPQGAELFERHPGLAAAIAWTMGQEDSILAERVVSLGRRDSLEKLAHALCELEARLSAIGMMRGKTIELPLNQEDFADILGISVIHVNRTFRRLSEEKTAEYRKGAIDLLQRDRLAEISAFDPAYLHLD
ncbi:MAG: Crp/Fnr family transcriptional regulator [Burkholderiales bacterium]|nr:MAG: Crp/Fnr family transcriptional regulator [Burkholderiales bacterium]